MEQINKDEAIANLKRRMEAKSIGQKRQENGCNEFYTPVYDDPIVIERHLDLSSYGLQRRYYDVTFDWIKQKGAPPEDKEVYNLCYKYARNLDKHIASGNGLILLGPVGTGKTSLAVCILREAINRGHKGYMISMISLLDTLLTLSKGPAEHYLKFENKIRNCPLLVLDDFGAEYDNRWVRQKVDSIIADRVDRKRATIITTNLSVNQIHQSYDSRIYDRLKTTSFVLPFRGQSKRQPLKNSEI